MKAAGCEAVIIGHCEERNNLNGILAEAGCKDTKAVNRILNQEIKCAVAQGLKVLYCIGEKERRTRAVAGSFGRAVGNRTAGCG